VLLARDHFLRADAVDQTSIVPVALARALPRLVDADVISTDHHVEHDREVRAELGAIEEARVLASRIPNASDDHAITDEQVIVSSSSFAPPNLEQVPSVVTEEAMTLDESPRTRGSLDVGMNCNCSRDVDSRLGPCWIARVGRAPVFLSRLDRLHRDHRALGDDELERGAGVEFQWSMLLELPDQVREFRPSALQVHAFLYAIGVRDGAGQNQEPGEE